MMRSRICQAKSVHLLSLVISLGIFWLVLSGHYTALLLCFGAASCLLCAWLCRRMNIVDAESQPHRMLPRMPGYWLWLTGETLKSNWQVARIVLSGRPVHPVTGYVSTPLKQDVVRATLANSITLTPGTLTLDVEDERLRIHALEPGFIDDLRDGDMVSRARHLEP